jgi:regulator of replication initiation timing
MENGQFVCCADADAGPSNWLLLVFPHMLQESVSEQLDALCDLSPLLAPARLKRYKEAADEVQQLRVENDRLRKQLARSRAANKQLKQKATGQQQ